MLFNDLMIYDLMIFSLSLLCYIVITLCCQFVKVTPLSYKGRAKVSRAVRNMTKTDKKGGTCKNLCLEFLRKPRKPFSKVLALCAYVILSSRIWS